MPDHNATQDRAAWLEGYFTHAVEYGVYASDSKLAKDIRKHGKREGIRRAARDSADLEGMWTDLQKMLDG